MEFFSIFSFNKKVIRAHGSHRLTGNLILQSSVNMLAIVVKARTQTMQFSAKKNCMAPMSVLPLFVVIMLLQTGNILPFKGQIVT